MIPSKIISRKSPKKVTSISVISKAPLKKKRLRKFSNIEVEKEEGDVGVSLIRKKKDADETAHKSTI